MWTLSGAGGVGRPVRVAGGKLVVADVFGHHELLHDHDMHGDEVVLDGRDALGTLGSAPVLLKEESCLRLVFERIQIKFTWKNSDFDQIYLEDWVLHVSLDPLHPLNALLASESGWK